MDGLEEAETGRCELDFLPSFPFFSDAAGMEEELAGRAAEDFPDEDLPDAESS